MFFINLPLRYLAATHRYLDHFLGPRPPWPDGFAFAPELGLDALAMQDLSPAWHRRLARRLREAGLRPSLHLPFFELSPGSLDDYAREAARRRLADALELAKVYGPTHLVGHPSFDESLHQPHKAVWLERSARLWSELLDAWPEHPPLYLENTREASPEPVLELVRALQPRNVKICFDVGHWSSFGRGLQRDDLRRWLDAFAPFLGHLHLHDNDGSDDQHLGLGQGAIPWDACFGLLDERGLRPSATFEPHTEEAMAATLDYIARNRALFAPFART